MSLNSHPLRIVGAGYMVTLVLALMCGCCLSLFVWLERSRLDSRHQALFAQTHFVPTPSPAEIAEHRRLEEISAGGRFYKPLAMAIDLPGVEQPTLQQAKDVDLPASTPVVGVEVNGTACAFVLAEMHDPRRHIVNLLMNQIPISVTYCNLNDCARVLSDDSSTPIPLHIGGLDIESQMVFSFQGVRYSQKSKALPLADYRFQRTTLGDWCRKHPATQVYVGANAS